MPAVELTDREIRYLAAMVREFGRWHGKALADKLEAQSYEARGIVVPFPDRRVTYVPDQPA